MTWLITFETNQLLTKDGKSITHFLDEAMPFNTQEEGWAYIDTNRETLGGLGENPFVTRLIG